MGSFKNKASKAFAQKRAVDKKEQSADESNKFDLCVKAATSKKHISTIVPSN